MGEIKQFYEIETTLNFKVLSLNFKLFRTWNSLELNNFWTLKFQNWTSNCFELEVFEAILNFKKIFWTFGNKRIKTWNDVETWNK